MPWNNQFTSGGFHIQALVLTVERQMVGELIDEDAASKADIGDAALEYALRGRGVFDRPLLYMLDNRLQVYDYPGLEK